MQSKSLLSGVILGWFFALWLGARLIDVNVPLISIPGDRLRDSIESAGLYCPYSLTVEQYWRKGPREHVAIEGGKGTVFLYREKIEAAFRNCRDGAIVVQWFLQQIRVDQLLMEVFLSEYIWLTVLGAAVACAMSRMFVFDPFITLRNAPMEYVEEMKSSENSYITHLMRQFVVEKILVLAYVIVRNPEKEQFLVRTSKSVSPHELPHRITDATVFAIWFILVWSVMSVTVMANQRFEMIVGFVKSKNKPSRAEDDVKLAASGDDPDPSEDVNTANDSSTSDDVSAVEEPTDGIQAVKESSNDLNTSKESTENVTRKDSPVKPINCPTNSEIVLMRRLLVVLAACFFTATALTSFGFTSFKVIHSFYALMITVEGLNLLIRGLYVTYRIAWWQASRTSPIRNTEAFYDRLYRANRLAELLDHTFSAIQYGLYLVVGTVINGKLIPLVFVTRLAHHLLRFTSTLYDQIMGWKHPDLLID
uniref:ABC transmembrane type-1 domain-containing protein n=2 Tax=Haemonchus contortus TaxID=6289 RepID=A0A7I4XS67_HAECO